MARVELQLPEQFIFTHTISVRKTDLNTAKHVGNDQMISLISEARYRFFCEYGLNEFSDNDYGIIVTDLVATYKSESYFRILSRKKDFRILTGERDGGGEAAAIFLSCQSY